MCGVLYFTYKVKMMLEMMNDDGCLMMNRRILYNIPKLHGNWFFSLRLKDSQSRFN